jgi:hypothetical protein
MITHPLTPIPGPDRAVAVATEAVVRGHGLVKRFGAGTSPVEALRGVDVAFAPGRSRPSWARRARASRR